MQFSDVDADVPVVLATGAVLGQGVAMPVVFTTGAHGSRTCRKRLEEPQMQFCVAGDVPVTMQRLCGVYGDGAVEGFFAEFLWLSSPSSSSELRPCQFMTVVRWTYTHS